MKSIQDIREDFALLDEWDDRYRYIIELGKALPPLPDEAHNAANKVQGCASQVWLAVRHEDDNGTVRLHYSGDSDALIVRGLVAIIISLFDGKTPAEIRATEAGSLFEELGLGEHLTQQRSNGLAAMVRRIKADAEEIAATA